MAPKYAFAAALAMQAATMGAAHPATTRGTSEIMIVGGDEAKPAEVPYIVSLTTGDTHFCGGTLLDANTVITAGHCSLGMEPSEVKVRAGTNVSQPVPLLSSLWERGHVASCPYFRLHWHFILLEESRD